MRNIQRREDGIFQNEGDSPGNGDAVQPEMCLGPLRTTANMTFSPPKHKVTTAGVFCLLKAVHT